MRIEVYISMSMRHRITFLRKGNSMAYSRCICNCKPRIDIANWLAVLQSFTTIATQANPILKNLLALGYPSSIFLMK